MAIRRTSSSFIIGFEQIKQQIELADNAEKYKPHKGKGTDKTSKTDSRLGDTEAFRSMTEHILPIDELCSRLETNIDHGLSEAAAQLKLRTIGPNKLTEKRATPWYCMFLKTLVGWFSLLMWAGAFLCLTAYGLQPGPSGVSNLALGLVLIGVVLLNSFFTFYQEMKSIKIMAGFKNMIPPVTMVVRDGKERELQSAMLVPGDIVQLKNGAKVPADIRILEAHNLKVDNSSLTGESEPQERKVECTNEKSPLETKNLAFFGTSVCQGQGKGLVITTGDRTVIGCIAKLANTGESEETTLNREIGRFVRIISVIAFCFGIVFLIAGILIGYDVVTNMVNTIGIIVANVPEGLMITVTVSMTITAKRMAAKSVLVKNLQSVETLGCTSCICSDKTGTLTENKMTIVALWYDLKAREVKNFERAEEGDLGYQPGEATFKMLQYCATLNNKCMWNFQPEDRMLKDDQGNDLSDEEADRVKAEYKENILKTSIKTWPVMGGDASETAMIKFFHRITDIDTVRSQNPIVMRNGFKAEIPFNSAYKYALTIHEPPDWAPSGHEGDCVLFMKGAPEQIWSRCSSIMLNGKAVKKNPDHDDEFRKTNRHYGTQGRRVLGFAMFWLPSDVYGPDYVFDPARKEGPNFPLEGFTFLGLSALEDPPKLRVKEAVESCHNAGIKVVMVTGDQPLTATAIARQVSIITADKTVNEIAEEKEVNLMKVFDESDAIAVHGEELSKFCEQDKDLPFEEQRLTLFLEKKEVVFARTSPAQKFLIVECAQKIGHIVAVTGDGVNDSPAIKKADIGIAMAIVGSDVAKDAADMLLMDDNFASIVDGVEEGRKVFDNLAKSIAYALVPNIPELLPFLSLVIFQLPVPLSPVLMILICLGTDMWPAISLAYEYPESDIMYRKPRNAYADHLVNFRLISFSYPQIGIMQTMAGFICYFTVMYDYGFPPQLLWFLALSTDGTQPKLSDVYTPESIYKGNTNVGNPSYDRAQVDWGSDNDGMYDLRIWYWKNNNWSSCRYADDHDSVHDYRVCYSTEALVYAQFAYYTCIVACQVANVITVKTKRISIIEHGLRNRQSWWGVLFELALTFLIAWVPGLQFAFGGRYIHFLHFFVPAMPIFILIICYDEMRKVMIRREHDKGERENSDKKGWFERNTLY